MNKIRISFRMKSTRLRKGHVEQIFLNEKIKQTLEWSYEPNLTETGCAWCPISLWYYIVKLITKGCAKQAKCK